VSKRQDANAERAGPASGDGIFMIAGPLTRLKTDHYTGAFIGLWRSQPPDALRYV